MTQTTATAIGESTVQGQSTLDFGIPFTLLEDGTIKELGIKLHAHATAQVLRTDAQGKHFRKALWEANQRTIDAKKKIAARKSSPSLSNQPTTPGKVCVPCGASKALVQSRKGQSKSSTSTPPATAPS